MKNMSSAHEISETKPDSFVMPGRSPDRPELPGLVFRRDRRVTYLLYVADVKVDGTRERRKKR